MVGLAKVRLVNPNSKNRGTFESEPYPNRSRPVGKIGNGTIELEPASPSSFGDESSQPLDQSNVPGVSF